MIQNHNDAKYRKHWVGANKQKTITWLSIVASSMMLYIVTRPPWIRIHLGIISAPISVEVN